MATSSAGTEYIIPSAGVRIPPQNVEAEVCTECGERYFHATTLDELERYLLAKHDVKERIQVEIVSL